MSWLFKIFLSLCLLACPVLGFTVESAHSILEKVDQQMYLPASKFKMRMLITYDKDDTREKQFEGYAQGKDFFFIRFLAPARDKETRYLKRENVMWLYLPKVDKVIQIKGHMLRQGMMGSDFSYEDASENSSLLKDYEPRLLEDELIAEKPAYVLELIAKTPKVTYYRRKLYIDKGSFMPLKSELYAKSGKLLKVATTGDIRKLDDRYYPFRQTMRNALKKNTLTVVETLELEIADEVNDSVFELRHLKRQ